MVGAGAKILGAFEVGDNCSIAANAVLLKPLEDNVTVYSGASILGGETVIGQGAVIGSNAFITSSVPANMRVSIKNPELQFKDRSGKVGELGQEGFFNRKETD